MEKHIPTLNPTASKDGFSNVVSNEFHPLKKNKRYYK